MKYARDKESVYEKKIVFPCFNGKYHPGRRCIDIIRKARGDRCMRQHLEPQIG